MDYLLLKKHGFRQLISMREDARSPPGRRALPLSGEALLGRCAQPEWRSPQIELLHLPGKISKIRDPRYRTLTRLAALATPSRGAGEGHKVHNPKTPLPHRGRGRTKRASAWWVRVTQRSAGARTSRGL